MYLLYLDDSGSVKNAEDKYIVLAGISVYEQAPYFLSNQLDDLAKKVSPQGYKEVEFHGTAIFSGRKEWRSVAKNERVEVYKEALSIIAKSGSNVRLFGAAIHKKALAESTTPKDSMEFAFEQLCSRFDLFIKRLHHSQDSKLKGQRGLIIFDKSAYETSLQGLAHDFREKGHAWGLTRNITEVPLFVDSKATRMIQYADLIAYAMRRNYEYGDTFYLDRIDNKFDKEGGIVHGLYHYKPAGEKCECLACASRNGPRKSREHRTAVSVNSRSTDL